MRNKKVVRLTESDLRNTIKKSVKCILKESEGNLEKEFSQWVRMVSTNPQEYGLNYNPMALLRDCYYGIEDNEESYSETDNMIYDMAEDFANYKGIDNDSMLRNAVKNVAYSNQLWESTKKVARLSESQLHNMISESVKNLLFESHYTVNELTEEDEQCCNRVIELGNKIAKYAQQYILSKKAGSGLNALHWANGIHECAIEILSEYDRL